MVSIDGKIDLINNRRSAQRENWRANEPGDKRQNEEITSWPANVICQLEESGNNSFYQTDSFYGQAWAKNQLKCCNISSDWKQNANNYGNAVLSVFFYR